MKTPLILSVVLIVIQVWEVRSFWPTPAPTHLGGGVCLEHCKLGNILFNPQACRKCEDGRGIGTPAPPTVSPPTQPPTQSLPSCQTFHCSGLCNQSSGRTLSSMCLYKMGDDTVSTGRGRTCAITGTKCCSVYPASSNCQTPAPTCNTGDFNICTF